MTLLVLFTIFSICHNTVVCCSKTCLTEDRNLTTMYIDYPEYIFGRSKKLTHIQEISLNFFFCCRCCSSPVYFWAFIKGSFRSSWKVHISKTTNLLHQCVYLPITLFCEVLKCHEYSPLLILSLACGLFFIGKLRPQYSL